jgi:sulfate permease family protein
LSPSLSFRGVGYLAAVEVRDRAPPQGPQFVAVASLREGSGKYADTGRSGARRVAALPGQVAVLRRVAFHPAGGDAPGVSKAGDCSCGVRSRPGVVSLFRWLPGLRAVRSYRRQWLAKDIVAGVVLTTLLVPQGMAYAELAGLPPITGLSTSIMCLLGYAVFGPSRILVLGPYS